MYIAEIILHGNQGSFHKVLNSLEEVRQFARAVGSKGDLLRVLRNDDKLANAREIVID